MQYNLLSSVLLTMTQETFDGFLRKQGGERRGLDRTGCRVGGFETGQNSVAVEHSFTLSVFPLRIMLNSSVVGEGYVSNTTMESLGTTLHQALNIVLTTLLALVVFALGCTVEIAKLLAHVRRPWGILVGISCQFVIMPLTAYLLALAFAVRPVQAVAILIMGCCPGGIISNIITYWMDGDMDLRFVSVCEHVLIFSHEAGVH